MKKDNWSKGFSLVELIVAILLMAIITVSLAPQVMKWVENSRISKDIKNYDTIVEAAQIAASYEQAMIETSGGSSVILLSEDTDTAWHADATTTNWTHTKEKMDEILGDDWMEILKPVADELPVGGYKIEIREGIVYRCDLPNLIS